MREPPLEHPGITEMLFCNIRSELGTFMFLNMARWRPETNPSPDSADSIKAKLQAVDELEARLQSKYLRHADLSVPLHLLSSIVVQSAIAKMRLRVYSPPRGGNKPPQLQSDRDAAYAVSIQVLEYDNEGYSSSTRAKLKGFMWHVRIFFQIEAFIFVLSELRIRTTGQQVDRAWYLIEAVYKHHPELLRETKNKLWFAVGNLCLKAWEQRVNALRTRQGGQHLVRPNYVQELYAQRGVKGRLNNETGNVGLAMEIEFPEQTYMQMSQDAHGVTLGGQYNATLPSTDMQFDGGNIGAMEWEYWQTLFDDYGVSMFT